jgi:glycosyltransferase involved in cell wall biosynthesis
MAASDCYVSMHRAGGFGLGMAEAMALGKPVIGTDYAGSTDFLSEETGYPVPYVLRNVEPDEYVHN